MINENARADSEIIRFSQEQTFSNPYEPLSRFSLIHIVWSSFNPRMYKGDVPTPISFFQV